MGAYDVGGNITDYLGKKIDKIVAMTQKAHARDCVWISPPKWRLNGKPVVDMIKAHVAPCVLFDSTDVEMQRKPDKVHPDEKGGDQWAVALWRFFRGPGRGRREPSISIRASLQVEGLRPAGRRSL